MEDNINNKELIACFLEKGFTLDFNIIQSKAAHEADKSFDNDLYKKYLENHYKMLFNFGFFDYTKKFSISIAFLHNVASKFIMSLSKTADIEFTRENTVLTPTEDEIIDILHSVPFVVGLEFININWIENIYQSLSAVFANEIRGYVGTVAEFLLEHNSKINVVGRVFSFS